MAAMDIGKPGGKDTGQKADPCTPGEELGVGWEGWIREEESEH